MKKFEIDGQLHEVIYIEYNKGIPFVVTTAKYYNGTDWVCYHWDFFENNGDTNDLRAYNHGSGGQIIYAPKWCDGYTGSYWLADGFKLRGKPKNAKRLKNPIPVADWDGRKYINPFKVAEITYEYEHCEECGHTSTEFCYEHKYWDEENGVARWIENGTCAD